jgi:nitrate/nitrite transporter NarK
MDASRWWPAVGLAVGVALGFAGAFGGFGAFIVVLVLGVVGLLAGWALSGQFDLSAWTGRRRRT